MNCILYVVDSLAVQLPTLHPGTIARILYVNASGVTSERTITVGRRFSSRHGVAYLRAYCHLRGEDRTFRVDRVLAVLDVEAARSADGVGHVNRVGHVDPSIDSARLPGTTVAPPRPVREPPAAPTPPPPAPARRARAGHGGRALCTLMLGILVVIGIGWLRGEMRESPAVSGRLAEEEHARRVAANESLLAASLGVRDDELTRLFGDADTDRDGALSWAEIETFQRHLNARYRYLPNDIALRPSQFISAGGGDCEDWALVTASLLHFWGVEASIGLVESDSGVHAVTLVPATDAPARFLRITVADRATGSSATYIPIDYTSVGSLSNAVGRSYTVTRVWRPDEIFGRAM